MADIQEMFEKLEPYEMNPEKKVKIRLFVLHSLVSFRVTVYVVVLWLAANHC